MVLRVVFGLVSIAGMMAASLLVMYMALHRSGDPLVDRLYEEKRAWARKWLVRVVIGLVIALGLVVIDGELDLESKLG
jgi:hypothetical protein